MYKKVMFALTKFKIAVRLQGGSVTNNIGLIQFLYKLPSNIDACT